MSWKNGATLFLAMWPVLKSTLKDKRELNELASALIALLEQRDMDVNDLLGHDRSLDKWLAAQMGLSVQAEKYCGLENAKTTLMLTARGLAQTLGVKASKEQDHACIFGRLAGEQRVVIISLYNWANREYTLRLAIESGRFPGGESLEILHKEWTRVVADDLSVEHLSACVLALLREALDSRDQFDKVVPMKYTKKTDYLEYLGKAPVYVLPS